MLKKASFTNQTAIITSLDPDYKSKWVSTDFLFTKYIKFTTQDAHNFTPGALISINGLYSTYKKHGGATYPAGYYYISASAMPIVNAKIIRVDSAKEFVIQLPDTFNDPTNTYLGTPNPGVMAFGTSNYYANSSGFWVNPTFPAWIDGGIMTSALGYDLYKANPFVTAHCNDGNLGAYKISYGDTV